MQRNVVQIFVKPQQGVCGQGKYGKYSGSTHLRKCILGKRDTEIFEKVSSYKKVLSLNEFHFQGSHAKLFSKFLDNFLSKTKFS